MKPERYDLIPVEALSTVAQLYGFGAQKYSAHNWRKGYEWSKSYAALQRHANEFWKGVDLDPETGLPHLAAVIFHCLTLITFMQEHPGFDDRYLKLTPEQRDELLADLRSQLTAPAETVRTEAQIFEFPPMPNVISHLPWNNQDRAPMGQTYSD